MAKTRLSDLPILSADAGALSAKHMRIAEIIQDYDPSLELAWIPPQDRTAFDAEPFAIFHNGPHGRYLIGTFPESKMNHEIIAHLWGINNQNGSVLDKLELEEKAKEAIRLREIMDEQAEREDFAKSLIKSRLHRYRHNGKVYQ